MNRKQFMKTTALAWGAGLISGCTRPDRDPNAAPATLHPPLERVGLQLYTVRALMAADLPGTLNAAAAIGYREVEFAGLFGHSPDRVRAWLDAAGLAAPAGHVGIEELSGPGLEAAIATAITLGHRWLVLPWLDESMRTPEGYRRAAGLLNAAGARTAAEGIRVAYHNHAFEFDPLPEGTTGFALLADGLDPALVDLEIDLHWSTAAGVAAADLFRRWPGRFPLTHLKGLAADGAMTAVGAGVIDWSDILARTEEAGFAHHFVEHDNPDDPLASITASFRYLAGRA